MTNNARLFSTLLLLLLSPCYPESPHFDYKSEWCDLDSLPYSSFSQNSFINILKSPTQQAIEKNYFPYPKSVLIKTDPFLLETTFSKEHFKNLTVTTISTQRISPNGTIFKGSTNIEMAPQNQLPPQANIKVKVSFEHNF